MTCTFLCFGLKDKRNPWRCFCVLFFHDLYVCWLCHAGQVEAAARAYRVYFSDTNELDDDDTDYLIDHSIVM